MRLDGKLLTLPIGVQSFERLRQQGCLYVDKTTRLLELAGSAGRCFLARPRRFGKSLTLSTLDAMFSGKAELFEGLAAEGWVAEQAKHPSPVLRFDISGLRPYASAGELESSLVAGLEDFARFHNMKIPNEKTGGGMLLQVIQRLFKMGGPVVVLIDEYDRPILDNIGDREAANAMRQVLRSFYTVLKSCDDYLRFVMLTGISKFSKAGVFSAMNNLQDISMNRRYGDIIGYTQRELNENFSDWLESAAGALSMSREDLLDKIESYYDGFCFDGSTRLYNPFSVLNFFSEQEFRNYWYESGSPSFIVTYMRQHAIRSPEEYRHLEVAEDFMGAQEIESAKAESFLCQSGYLTIEKREERSLTLDYPNREVLDSLSRMYLEHVYHVESYVSLGSSLWRALKEAEIPKVIELYNIALAGIPYEDYDRQEGLVPTAAHGGARMRVATKQGESWYRSLFLMLLRGAGITAHGEVHTNRGRSDILARFPESDIVLEFKYAERTSEVERKRAERERQIQERNYAKPYEGGCRRITTAVIVVDGEKREAVL